VDKREAAAVLAQCKWLRDNIKRWEDAAKKTLSLELEPGERAAAVDSEGVQLGFAAMVAGRKEVKVSDEAAFTAWCAERWPTEITRAVKPAFRKALEDKAKLLGGLPDEVTGLMCPYVTVVGYDPFPKVTLSEWADAVLSHRIQQKKLMEVITPPSELPPSDVVYERIPDGILPAEHDEDPSAPTKYLHVELSETRTVDPEPEVDPEPRLWDESTTFEDSDAVRQRRGQQ
jgi:hypothetical protein